MCVTQLRLFEVQSDDQPVVITHDGTEIGPAGYVKICGQWMTQEQATQAMIASATERDDAYSLDLDL